MRLALNRAHAWMVGHLGLSLALAAALLLLGLGLFRHATTEQDVGAMLPGGPGSPAEAARLLSEFGTLNALLVDLELPGASEEQLADAGRQLAQALRQSGRFREVYSGPTTEDALAVGRLLLPHRLLLLENPAQEIEARLEPTRLRAELETLKRQLGAPEAMVLKQQLLADPLGLDASVLTGLGRLAGDVHPAHGQLLSKDGHHLLLVTTPAGSALDAQASAALLDTVAAAAARLPPGPSGPAVVTAVGGPRFAAESAGAVRRDVVVTFLTSLVALVLLFLVRFRNLRLLGLTFVPIGFGVVGGLATVVLVQGHIHALTFAFGSVLVGIAIDYPLYLLNAASVQPGTPLERMRAGLESTWRSLWLAFTTTLIAFVMMLLSEFPGLRELALFAAGGIVTAFVTTLVLFVPLSAVWGPRQWPAAPRWMAKLRQRAFPPWVACGVTLLVLAASLGLAPTLRFDGELRHLDAQRPESLAQFDQVLKRFGLQETDSLVVARAGTAQEALALDDAVSRVLVRLAAAGTISHAVGLGSFLPAVETQARRAHALSALDIPQAKARLSAGGVEAGFTPGAFDGFWTDVAAVQAGRLAPLVPADFEKTSLAPLLRQMLRCGAQGCIAVSSLQVGGPAQLSALLRELPSGATVLNAEALAQNTVARIPRQLASLCGLGLLLNVVLLAFAYRSLKRALLACLPGCLGLAGTIGLLAALHVPLNLVSASALVLILGCGVDYGIFALQGLTAPSRVAGMELMGVLLTSLTALAGFGTLVLASYRALQFLGAAVGLGILLSALSALFLLAGVYSVLERPAAQPGGAV